MGVAVGKLLHFHFFQHVLDALVNLGLLLPSRRLQHKGQVVIYRAVAQELEVLKDDAHLSAQGRDVFLFHGEKVVIQYHSIVGFVNVQLEIECLQECALAGSHASDDIDEFTFIYMEINILQDKDAVFLIYIRFLIIY